MNNTLAAVVAAAVGFVVTAVSGFIFVPFLRKLKFGQTILDIGPAWHRKKQGTPVMGGIMFIIGTIAAIFVALPMISGSLNDSTESLKTRFWSGILMALGFALIGFFDDYIKVVKKRNLGLTIRQKMILEILVASSYIVSLYMAGSTSTIIPFIGPVDFGIFFFPLSLVLILGMVNAVNFTDGVDGLCSGVTTVVSVALMLCGTMTRFFSVSVAGAALAGACLGFLIWNFHPAKVFMGDTGSFFLGSMVCMLAFSLNMPVLLLPVGIIYIIEIMSVVLQVIYFKLTRGKRLFKMSPIHHHFEIKGWSEVKIVAVFCFITLIGSALAVASVFFGYKL